MMQKKKKIDIFLNLKKIRLGFKKKKQYNVEKRGSFLFKIIDFMCCTIPDRDSSKVEPLVPTKEPVEELCEGDRGV